MLPPTGCRKAELGHTYESKAKCLKPLFTTEELGRLRDSKNMGLHMSLPTVASFWRKFLSRCNLELPSNVRVGKYMMHVCTYIYIYILYIYICVYTCVYTCVYAYLFVCFLYIYIYMFLFIYLLIVSDRIPDSPYIVIRLYIRKPSCKY